MIVVSACLAGIPCRWDCGSKPHPKAAALVREGKAIPLCPEQLGGLATPRPPSEIRGGRVVSKTGADVTEVFEKGARIVLDVALRNGCAEAILKARSPSCGPGFVYDGTFSGVIVPGDGITARLLKANGIRVRSEEEL
jgi:uncharacterized protein YbbK (DUF523 family)